MKIFGKLLINKVLQIYRKINHSNVKETWNVLFLIFTMLES